MRGCAYNLFQNITTNIGHPCQMRSSTSFSETPIPNWSLFVFSFVSSREQSLGRRLAFSMANPGPPNSTSIIYHSTSMPLPLLCLHLSSVHLSPCFLLFSYLFLSLSLSFFFSLSISLYQHIYISLSLSLSMFLYSCYVCFLLVA